VSAGLYIPESHSRLSTWIVHECTQLCMLSIPGSPYSLSQIENLARQAHDRKGLLMPYQTIVDLASALTTIRGPSPMHPPEGAQAKHLGYQNMPKAEEVFQTVDFIV
jgi:hypothetical protein